MAKGKFSLGLLIGMLAAIASLVHAGEMEHSLRQRIAQSLESSLAVEGIENCENKCSNSFDRFAYQVAVVGRQKAYEFRACVDGCNRCTQARTNNEGPDVCFKYCKDRDWKVSSIIKGVIEPDKACLGGCIINTCQAICTGGTTESNITPANKKFFFPNGGCSIKTEPYTQNLEYVPWDSPNTGQGGSAAAAVCCANALTLCDYVGDRNTANYQNVFSTTTSSCNAFVAPNRDAICNWFTQIQNCGTLNVA